MDALGNLPKIFQVLNGTMPADVVGPLKLVYTLDGYLTGYSMRNMSHATTLGEFASSSDFPLAEVVGRVSVAMKSATIRQLLPLIEHEGNVLVSLQTDGNMVMVIDVDGWVL